jgi:hypothetical protein
MDQNQRGTLPDHFSGIGVPSGETVRCTRAAIGHPQSEIDPHRLPVLVSGAHPESSQPRLTTSIRKVGLSKRPDQSLALGSNHVRSRGASEDSVLGIGDGTLATQQSTATMHQVCFGSERASEGLSEVANVHVGRHRDFRSGQMHSRASWPMRCRPEWRASPREPNQGQIRAPSRPSPWS